jgi:DNA-directed RNA polymerase subunit RPC12/RpoP
LYLGGPMQRIISSDGQEPCVQCGSLVHVARAILIRELAPGETPTLLGNNDPYAPGVQICCSRACADIVSDTIFLNHAVLSDDEEEEIICPECSFLMMILTDGEETYATCPNCGLIDQIS